MGEAEVKSALNNLLFDKNNDRRMGEPKVDDELFGAGSVVHPSYGNRKVMSLMTSPPRFSPTSWLHTFMYWVNVSKKL